MSSRKELAGVRIDICSLREALHKIEHYLASEGLHAVETVSMKTVVTAGEDEQVRQCLEDMDLVIPSDKEILMELGVTSRKWLDEARVPSSCRRRTSPASCTWAMQWTRRCRTS